MSLSKQEIKALCETDIRAFARLVNPNRLYGPCHDDAFLWMTCDNATDSQLLLYPRAHQKSHLIAVWAAWWITKHPDTSILYVSATEDLATSQLYAIKQLLESDVYRKYWPEMIHPDQFKRAEWSARNIMVDHPLRGEMGVRDRTVAARAIGGNTTGLHADVIIFDDIVVPGNAYTILGRSEVAASYSQFSSVLNPGGMIKAVGTRYHPKDIYSVMKDEKVELFDDEGNITGESNTYQVLEKKVHDEDGNFLWPRAVHPVTKRWYGFNPQTLARIRAKYLAAGERVQYFAQYFNEPNDPESNRVSLEKFQYYDRERLTSQGSVWYYDGEPLAVYAGADLAFTTGTRSDYTAFAVIGINPKGYIYILDLVEFKTNKYEKYYTTLEALYDKWVFKKIRLESNAGANLIVEYVKDRCREEGRAIIIEGKAAKGEKEERAAAILEPRYENNTIWHYRGGTMNRYEEQLILARPANDDIRDAVSIAVEIGKVPKSLGTGRGNRGSNIVTHSRFGGRVKR